MLRLEEIAKTLVSSWERLSNISSGLLNVLLFLLDSEYPSLSAYLGQWPPRRPEINFRTIYYHLCIQDSKTHAS